MTNGKVRNLSSAFAVLSRGRCRPTPERTGSVSNQAGSMAAMKASSLALVAGQLDDV